MKRKLSPDEVLALVRRASDTCTHPDCVARRKQGRYSLCASGHVAQTIVSNVRVELRKLNLKDTGKETGHD